MPICQDSESFRELSDLECQFVSGGVWARFNSFEDYQFQAHNWSYILEDGTHAVWLMEDWEIYGQPNPYSDFYAGSQTQQMLEWFGRYVSWAQYDTPNVVVTGAKHRLSSTSVVIDGAGNEYWRHSETGQTIAKLAGASDPWDVDDEKIVVTGTLIGVPGIKYSVQKATTINNNPYSTINDGLQQLIDQTDSENMIYWLNPLTSGGLSTIEQQRWDQLIAVRNEILTELEGLPATAAFVLSDGTRVSINEFATLLRFSDWSIWEAGHDFGNGGVGASDRNNGDPILHVSLSGFMGWTQSREHMIFYLLHEIAHVTKNGFGRYDYWDDPNSENGTQVTDNERNLNEVWASDLARGIANILTQRGNSTYGVQGGPASGSLTVQYNSGAS